MKMDECGGLREHAVEFGREYDRMAVTIEGHFGLAFLSRIGLRVRGYERVEVSIRNFRARFN